MKALVNRRTIIIASISLLIAFITIISVNVFNSAGPVTGFANTVTRPIRALASTVARTFGDIYAALYRYEELERRNEELLQIIAERSLDYYDATALALENAQYRDLLGFQRRHGRLLHVQASLENWTGDNWTHTFTINKGYANSNVMQGMGVSTEAGILIGQILTVEATTSTVITVLDTRFSAAVFIGGETIEDSDGTANAKGDITQMRNGLLIIDYIDDNAVVNQGSFVVTSGSGGVFPAGLIVGMVERVYNHTSGIGRYATVRPGSPINAISLVYVILGYDLEREQAEIMPEDPFEDLTEDPLEDPINDPIDDFIEDPFRDQIID